MSTFLELQAYALHHFLWPHCSRAQTITGNSLNTIVGSARPALTGVLVAPFRHRCFSCFRRFQILKMDSGRSGNKGKGFKAKVPVSTNQNSAHQNSDRTVCGACASGSHLVSSSGTGCAPKDSASTIRNSAQSHIADKTTCGSCDSGSHLVSSSGTGCAAKDSASTIRNSAESHIADRSTSGPCGSSSRSVSSSGTERAPSVFNPPPSVWGSKKLVFNIALPTEGSSGTERAPTIRNSAESHIADRSTSGPCGSSSRSVSSSGTERAPSVFNPPPSVWGSKKLDFSVGGHNIALPTEGSSGTERVPSVFNPPPSVWGSKKLDFSVGGHNIALPTEGNSISGAPSAGIESRESESMEVQENPHVVRESKGVAGGAIQGVERSSGKSVEEPSGSVTLKTSSLDAKKKQRAEGYNPGVMNKGSSTSSESKDRRGNKVERSDVGRGGRRGGYGSQHGEYDGRSGSGGGWSGNRGGRGGRGRNGRQRGESDGIDALGRLLSSVLRHRDVELILNIRSDGYVAVEDLLKLNIKTYAGLPLYSYSFDDFREHVQSEELLTPILSAEEVPVCVHGTYLTCLESIKKDGLKRMKRNHVHFASGLSKDGGVISGMRGNCQVLIYLDAKKALQDGMKLFFSENGVILTEGFDGVVPPKYFAKIETLEHNRSKKY